MPDPTTATTTEEPTLDTAPPVVPTPTKAAPVKLEDALACVQQAFGAKCERILNRRQAEAIMTAALRELWQNR